MKAFIVVSHASWVATDFEPFIPDDIKLIRDYGFDVPPGLDTYSTVMWWMPAQHAARLQRVSVATDLIAPGNDWLTTVPEHLLGRKIHVVSLGEALDYQTLSTMWMKPSEAKIDGFEAGLRTIDELRAITGKLNMPTDASLQWTTSLLSINHEYRFYVLDGKVLTGSAYLVDGVTYYDGASNERLEEAQEFAQHVVDTLADNQPSAYTLDVGLDTVAKRWIMIEGNPAWCSGIYGADPAKALQVIERSCTIESNDEKFRWTPDAYLQQIAHRKVPLQKM